MAISSQLFITSQQVGPTLGSFLDPYHFNNYFPSNKRLDASYNGGLGYLDVPGTDLRIFKVQQLFSDWATLYSGSDEVGKTMVMVGDSDPKLAAVTDGSTVKGWTFGTSSGASKWGTNTIDGIISSSKGPLLVADFDAATGTFEAIPSFREYSPAFILDDDGIWKLAGIGYGIDAYDTNATTGDGSEFMAAMFDTGGYYTGSDAMGWTYVPDGSTDVPGQMYFSQISPSAAFIQAAIVNAPEPAAVLLLGISGLWGLRRRR